jgi:SAM-dependent methyltransferase
MAFGELYAGLYDHFYRDKDYRAECDLLERLWQRFGGRPQHVLDLGCGTGGHALELARRGYRPTGVDRSEPMLEIARAKADDEGLQVELHGGDICALDLGRSFDVVIAMFAVFGYLTSNQELEQGLAVARRHLRAGEVLVFDCWHGPAVLRHGPEARIASFDTPDGDRVLRLVTPELDSLSQVVTVSYEILRMRGDRVVEHTTEAHRMRYLFPQEITHFLTLAGFDEVSFYPFGDIDASLTVEHWNMLVAAR